MPARKEQSASSHVKPKVAVRIDTEARSQNANSAPRIVTNDDRLRPKRGSPLGTWATLGSVVVLVLLLAAVIAFLTISDDSTADSPQQSTTSRTPNARGGDSTEVSARSFPTVDVPHTNDQGAASPDVEINTDAAKMFHDPFTANRSLADLIDSPNQPNSPAAGSGGEGHNGGQQATGGTGKPPGPQLGPLPGAGKHQIPDSADRQEKIESIRQLFTKEYKLARSSEVKSKLALYLMEQLEQETDPGYIFAILQEARRLACEAGEVDIATNIVAEIDRRFEVNHLAVQISTLKKLAATKRNPQRRKIAEESIKLATWTVTREEYTAALELLKVAAEVAQSLRDANLTKTAREWAHEIKRIQTMQHEMKAALRSLDENSDDTSANLVTGKYLCFVKYDWAAGLEHLSRSGSDQLAELARKDLASPQTAGEQHLLGDDWYLWGEEAAYLEQVGAWRRAAHWYRQSVDELNGLSKLKVNKRLEELENFVHTLRSPGEPPGDSP